MEMFLGLELFKETEMLLMVNFVVNFGLTRFALLALFSARLITVLTTRTRQTGASIYTAWIKGLMHYALCLYTAWVKGLRG